MNYHAEISVTEDIDNVYRCFSPEMESTPRAKVSLRKTEGKLTVGVNAKDSVALKAMLNGITRLFELYEKVQKNG